MLIRGLALSDGIRKAERNALERMLCWVRSDPSSFFFPSCVKRRGIFSQSGFVLGFLRITVLPARCVNKSLVFDVKVLKHRDSSFHHHSLQQKRMESCSPHSHDWPICFWRPLNSLVEFDHFHIKCLHPFLVFYTLP